MLSFEDLKKLTKLPDEKDISLSLYADFYERFIAHRTYEIKLETGKNIILQMTPNNFPHLVGLHKFKLDQIEKGNYLLKNEKQLKEFNGFLNLLKGGIKLNDLKLVKDSNGKSIFDEYKARILGVPFIYQMLRKSDFISFNASKVDGETTIKGEYAFIEDVGASRNHLFIKMNEDSPKFKGKYFPMTFIITNDNDLSKNQRKDYFTKNQDFISINEVIIRDLKTNGLQEILRRKDKDIAYKEAASTKESKISSLDNQFYSTIVTKAQLNYIERKGIKIEKREETDRFNRFKIHYNVAEHDKINNALKQYKSKDR